MCSVTWTSVIISPFRCCHCHYHHHPTPAQAMTSKQLIISPSISCLNEAKPGTVDQNVMQSVDLPLLDIGPSDAMSSLDTAVKNRYETYQKSQYIQHCKDDEIFPIGFVCSGVSHLPQKYYSIFKAVLPNSDFMDFTL
jgi:hypothetical protein